MQKILGRRVLRDLKENLFRYLALALLIVLSMYIIVSMVGSAETIIRGSEETDQEHGVEDGEFSLFVPMTDEEWKKLTDRGITLEKQFFLDYQTDEGRTIRVFRNRESINTVEIVEGELADTVGEIVIERKYADKHAVKVGDELSFGGRDFTVCGIGVTPDYNSPLRNLGDSTVDSKNFGTAFVTADTYEAMLAEGKSAKSEEYYYAYILNDVIRFLMLTAAAPPVRR